MKGVAAVTAGGHFSGSLVLCWERYLFIADTIVTVPVSLVFYLCCHVSTSRFLLYLLALHIDQP